MKKNMLFAAKVFMLSVAFVMLVASAIRVSIIMNVMFPIYY